MTVPATVLVVEDEALIADDIQRTLTRLGYHVPVTAASAKEAIRAAGTIKPALVLMDIKLQGAMDGIDAAREIRAQFRTPIVFLTSHSDDATLTRAKETEPYGYLLKPFNERELRTAIEVAIHKHQLESTLATRERWFATTLESIGDAVIATDRNEAITFMNPVAERVTGWSKEDATGKPLSRVLRLVTAAGEPIPSPVGLALKSEFAVALPPNAGLIKRDGTRVAVDDSAAKITSEHGEPLGGVVVFRDVTERKKLELRLAQSERLASLGTLAAGMGHEINNPLIAVVANLGFADEAARTALDALGQSELDKGVATTQLRVLIEALADATRGAERVRRIVQDLRRFARAEATASQALELSDVIDAAIKLNLHEMPHTRVVRDFGTTPFVLADEGQLTQVFTNLLVNAAQAMSRTNVASNEIRIRTSTDPAGRAVAEVSDTGPGIPQDVLPRVFDPFFTTKRIGEGMGLGLALCHNFVSSLGGEITAESTPRGATFKVALPAARIPNQTQTIRLPLLPDTTPRAKVLVIDDEEVVVRSLQRILSKVHEVDTATDGATALSMVAHTRYDMILCDIMMPNMSGVDLYESIAAVNPEQAQRMVFMTGGAFTARTQQFLETTKNKYVLKPFSSQVIKALAAEVTSGKL